MISGKFKILFLLPAMLLFVWSAGLWAEPFKYDPHGKRDPFVPLVGQERPSASVGFGEIASVDDVKVEGIALEQSGKRMAILNGEIVKEGFKSGEVEVKKINKNSVIISISGKEYTINLPEEGGAKSE